MYRPRVHRRILIALVLVACSKSRGESPPADQTAPAPQKRAGVDPEKFQCASIAPEAELATVLGGAIRVMETNDSPARNVARPCNYLVTRDAAASPEPWFFDVDCRPGYQERAEEMFKEYAKDASDQVAAYQAQVGSGKTPTDDAGVAFKAPEGSTAVAVGKKALDHHGQGLLFVDDDAPCYVRVVGPDAARRLALAQMVARHLTPETAPSLIRGAH